MFGKRILMVQHADGHVEIDPDVALARWSTDAERETWHSEAQQSAAELAQQKHDEYLTWIADQEEDYKDFLNWRGDCAL